MAKEAAEAKKQASSFLGVEETQVRLAEELVEVCRDYCNATWDEAFNVVGVPADSAWRQHGSIYYHPNIREIPGAIPSSSTLAPETSEQPLTAQVALPLPEASKGPNQAGNQGQGADGAKDQAKGKDTKPSSEAKTKEIDPQAKDVSAS